MPGRRVERLNEQFRRELTEILHGAAKDPRVAQVTITAVRTVPDLSFARVYVAPGAGETAEAEMLAGLRAAIPFLRHELGTRLHIRRVPELRFEVDRALAYGRRIEELLHQVSGSTAAGVDGPPGDGPAAGAETGDVRTSGAGTAGAGRTAPDHGNEPHSDD